MITSAAERGVAVIVAVMALAMLTALGAGLVLTTSTEGTIAARFRSAIEVRHAALAIAERALADLDGHSSWDSVLDGSARSSFADGVPGGTRHLADGTTIDLDGVVHQANCGKPLPCTAAELVAVTARRPWGVNNPRWRQFAWGPLRDLGVVPGQAVSLYGVALVGDDGSENDGDPVRDGIAGANPGAGVLMVRVEAFGTKGARATVELAVGRLVDGRANVISWNELR